VVTEFQGHARTCPGCGHVTRAAIPAEIRAHAFGPRLAAVLSYLSGSQYVSQRGLEDVSEVVFGDPVAVVITLQRRRKKRSAGSAGRPPAPTTTSGRAVSATCPVATSASISTSRPAGSPAPGVAA
jgi:hypothetical protein